MGTLSPNGDSWNQWRRKHRNLLGLAAKFGWQLVKRNVTKLRAEGFEILGGVQTFRHSTHS